MSVAVGTDPIVAEVRQIRRSICEGAGHDLDRLAEQLRRVEQDYAARTGTFSHVGPESAAAVQAGWGNLGAPRRDEIVDDVRDIRRKLAESSSGQEGLSSVAVEPTSALPRCPNGRRD